MTCLQELEGSQGWQMSSLHFLISLGTAQFKHTADGFGTSIVKG